MGSFFKIVIVLVLSAGLISCSDSTSAAGGGSDAPGSGPSTSVDSPLSAEVKLNYIDNTSKTIAGTCTVPRTAAVGTNITCNIQIPELIAHFSDYEFNISTNSQNTCRRVTFAPYMFRRSTSATFLDTSGTENDCSAGAYPICYGGAAKHIVEKAGHTFPESTGLYFLTAVTLQQSYKMDAPDTTRESDLHRSVNTSNLAVTNNLSVSARAAAVSNPHTEYVPGSFRDYVFTCQDSWGETVYSITLIIGDDDIVDTPHQTPRDTYWDWGGL